MEPVVIVESASGVVRQSRETLAGLATSDAAEQAGRWSEGFDAVPVRALAGTVDLPPDADHVTFHAADGYAASLPLEQALREGVVLVPLEGSSKVGVRLVVRDGATTCLNVKAVTRVVFSAGPGKHTVDPNPHDNAFVPGWDG